MSLGRIGRGFVFGADAVAHGGAGCCFFLEEKGFELRL